ncbi:MAG: apolipoprotein N-acyltransferase [Verrucomicrobia bacterium RIFCSPHIGHO2_12_FULL_41_10]|nr:MAG: apolipoprotein N-acyltransferase [Verrucomicrobia bacterium RIFCSPHIGHO2_12_FULL_41_10]HLB34281.1 apolipoprotein N-acyltransferase [Chthoniobacterales bacterium]
MQLNHAPSEQSGHFVQIPSSQQRNLNGDPECCIPPPQQTTNQASQTLTTQMTMWAVLLALFTGATMSLGFPPYEISWLSWMPWIAFTPLTWALLFLPLPTSVTKRIGYAFLLGFVATLFFFLLTLAWLVNVAWEGLVTLPFALACYGGLWSLFVVMVVRPLGESKCTNMPLPWLSSLKNLCVAILSASAWTGLEWLRGVLFTGFGWNSFGVAFRHNLPVLQITDITGVGGLSFLGVLTGTIAVTSIKRFYQEIHLAKNARPISVRVLSKRPHFDLTLTLLLIVMVMGYGMRELLAPATPRESLSIAAIQGNIPQNHKWDPAFEASIMRTYVHLTEMALASEKSHPDLILWPEAATPRPLLQDKVIFTQVEELAKKSSSDFLIGSLHYEEKPPKDYNAAILLTEGASQFQFYAKTHLVPFGEYIPFRKGFPLFQWIIGNRILGDFDAGPGPKLLKLSTKPIEIAPLLCFEDTLGDLVRRFALLGAQLLVTLTNDGWFGHSTASQQHVANAQLRCAETKLPMLRVANTGVTCLINPWGRITETLQAPNGSTFIEGILSTQCHVPLHPQVTFYTRHGDLFAQGCLGLTLFAAGVQIFLRRRGSKLQAKD